MCKLILLAVAMTSVFATNLTDSSLVDSAVKPVIGGICVSCVFSSYSTASGCTVLLYNDEHTLNFNASCQSPEDIALLECFEMSQVGLFHVEVSVVRQDRLEKQMPLQLPDITTVPTPEKSVNGTIFSWC